MKKIEDGIKIAWVIPGGLLDRLNNFIYRAVNRGLAKPKGKFNSAAANIALGKLLDLYDIVNENHGGKI